MTSTLHGADALLGLAGLTKADFLNIQSVAISEFSGRIIVTVGSSISPQPIEEKEVLNLVATHYEIGYSRYIFNVVLPS